MIGAILIKQTGPTPELMKREMNAIMTGTLAAVADNHFRFMHMHFEPIAFSRYGYKPRKGMNLSGKPFYRSYTGRKMKRFGHMLPLVYSGESRDLALGNKDVRATRKEARLVQHARGLNRRNPRSDIRMNDEIRAIAPSEEREAVRVAEREFKKRVRAITATKTTRV